VKRASRSQKSKTKGETDMSAKPNTNPLSLKTNPLTVANPFQPPAASGPSASKAHGAGEAPKAPATNPHEQQPGIAEGYASKDLGEPVPPAQDFGTGKTAPAASNNDISYSPAPK
jgi:hypothetical protein